MTSLAPPSRSEAIARHGGPVAAVFPIHYPRALLRAFGLLPVEVWGPLRVDAAQGGAHVQPYVCSIVRNGLSFVLSGGLDLARVLIVPHACDSLQGLGSMLIDFTKPSPPVLPFYLPRSEGEASLTFLEAEIRALARGLASLGLPLPTDDALLAAVHREEAADAALGRLWDERSAIPLGQREFYVLARSREYLPAEEFTSLADAALREATSPSDRGVPVVLSGLLPEPAELLDVVENAGAHVVADDHACNGRRLYPPGTSADPWRRMAERLAGAPPCSTRGSSMRQRADHLQSLAARTGARGVVFSHVKFCEPEQFYLPRLQAALEEQGLRCLAFEVELGDPLPAQVATRVEALVESLEEGAP